MLSTVPVQCPPWLLAKAKQIAPVPTAVANANSSLVLTGARMAHEQGLLRPVLVGDPGAIVAAAAQIGWSLSGIRIEPASTEQHAAEMAVSLARHGEVRAIMKGDMHTDVLLRAVLARHIGLRTGRLLSHVFHMSVPGSERSLCITDAVLNVLPSVEQKIQIARNAAGLMHALGNTHPKIALLSATETEIASMPSSVDAATIARMAQATPFEGFSIDGPLALDLAISPRAAKIKGVTNPVAGQADVLLVPNIETGNALFKAMVYLNSAAAAGVILGARVPIMLTSRADPPPARLASAALASILALTRLTQPTA